MYENISYLTVIHQDVILQMLNYRKMQKTKMRFFQTVTLSKPLNMVDFFRFLLHPKVLKLRLYKTYGWKCIGKASLTKVDSFTFFFVITE